jgi:hypothetical protein
VGAETAKGFILFKSSKARASWIALSVAIAALTTLTIGNALAAPSGPRPVSGKGTGVETVYADPSCPAGTGFTVVGSGNQSGLGATTFVNKGCWINATDSVSTSITTAANGDTLTATVTASGTTTDFTATQTVTGGTGKFAGATGSATITGTVGEQVFTGDPSVFRIAFSLSGTISY